MHRTRNPANQVFPWRAGSNPVLSLNQVKKLVILAITSFYYSSARHSHGIKIIKSNLGNYSLLFQNFNWFYSLLNTLCISNVSQTNRDLICIFYIWECFHRSVGKCNVNIASAKYIFS